MELLGSRGASAPLAPPLRSVPDDAPAVQAPNLFRLELLTNEKSEEHTLIINKMCWRW
jgi:hypothetical protein